MPTLVRLSRGSLLLIAAMTLLPAMLLGQVRSHDHLPHFGPSTDREAVAHYTLDMTHADDRQFYVTCEFIDRPGHETVLALPVWSMGSYLIREYAKNVSHVEAMDAAGNELSVEKVAKDRWRVDHPPGATIRLSYRVYGGQLTVRTPYITTVRAAWQATSVFVHPEGEELAEWTIRTVLPADWEAEVIASPVDGQPNTWRGQSLDRFYDTVGIAGPLTSWEFSSGGLPHRIVFDGDGNYHRDELLPLIEEGFRITREMMEWDETATDSPSPALPIDDYGVLVSLANDGGGGLEHFRGTLLLWERWSLASRWDRLRFLTLCVHEYFHLWNVKHIRPEHFHDYQYDRENYTRNLFEIEGMTSYYDIVLSGRAVGAIGEDLDAWTDDWLKLWEREIQTHEGYPGRYVESLRQSSFDTWIKFYRRDENFVNTSIHYYRKGAIVSALLDAAIRDHSDGDRSLDDVWRYLWQEYLRTGDGYPAPDGVMHAVQAATGFDATDFFARYVEGTEPLPYDDWLDGVGLRLSEPDSAAWMGVSFAPEDGRVLINTVLAGGPGDEAGLSNGDEVIAIDGWRVIADGRAADWDYAERLDALHPGDTVTLTLGREGRLLERTITLGVNPATMSLEPVADPSEEQMQRFEAWCGLPHPAAGDGNGS